MIPVDLDPTVLNIGLVARGPALQRRLRFLRMGGARKVRVFSDDPGEELADRLGDRIIARLPEKGDLRGMNLLFIAGLTPEEYEPLIKLAKRRGIMINCEDVKDQCDFHVPAVVRRGDLVFAVSTAGKSPALAKRLRKYIAEHFGEEWKNRVSEIGKAREIWKQNGASMKEVNRMSNAMIDENDWMP